MTTRKVMADPRAPALKQFLEAEALLGDGDVHAFVLVVSQPPQDVFRRRESNRCLGSHIEVYPGKIRACEERIEKIRVNETAIALCLVGK